MKFREFLKENIVVLDGAMGTLLEKRGLSAGEAPEKWNLTNPEAVTEVHRAYFKAGSDVVLTNTFGANPFKYGDEELEAIIKAALENAKAAKIGFGEDKFVALDIGPSGKLLEPLGELGFSEALSAFSKVAALGEKYGADLIFIETMTDSYETKAALLGVKEATEIPVIVSNAYGSDGKLLTGASPLAMISLLEGMGADAIGANCSQGPEELAPVLEEFCKYSSSPIVMKPNAGLPVIENGEAVFKLSAEDFAKELLGMVNSGARVVGGCCGTTPAHIEALSSLIKGRKPTPVSNKKLTIVSSYLDAVIIGNEPLLIGERINPTGKKRFKEALVNSDMDYIISEGLKQEELCVHMLDVNVGLPGIDEKAMLVSAVRALQSVSALPLVIDTADTEALEAALRIYNGKALINSVSAKESSMASVFPLMKKYGGVAIALTLDENGIPETAEERLMLARKIVERAAEYGIPKESLVFDTLTMTVSANPDAAKITLDALSKIRSELSCNTSLGVSNVSYGLPARDTLNATFFTLALANGLSLAIMNPYSSEMMKSYLSFRALSGYDKNFEGYINASESFCSSESFVLKKADASLEECDLFHAIEKGLKEKSAALCEELLKNTPPLDVIEKEIIPALNSVGAAYEKKTLYLPSLLMSAEAAGAAFEKIKKELLKSNTGAISGEKIVIATVEGDVHDIGKNIVKLILQNYGYKVIDRGKNVPAEEIVQTAIEENAKFVALSALMTTTVPAMEKTIKQLKAFCPSVKTIVGGAVLSADYAKKIGADAYAPDAISAVRILKNL